MWDRKIKKIAVVVGIHPWLVSSALGVIFFDTGDVAHNREVAPTGAYEDSGWQYQGDFGDFLATKISPNHIITAKHIGVHTTFVSQSYFNGTAMDVSYGVDNTVNGGLGYWNIGTTDLRIFQVTGTFSSYAPLYTGGDEVGKELVVMGRGTQRGTTVNLGGTDKGWKWGGTDGRARWGRNNVTNINDFGALGEMLAVDFDAESGIDESHLSSGDSGGSVFIQDAGVWKLAGINYAVDGDWDTNDTTGDGTSFRAALTDAGGFYNGSDGSGWTLIDDEVEDIPSQFYASRISAQVDSINAITGVPEPSSMLLFLTGCLGFIFRRCRT